MKITSILATLLLSLSVSLGQNDPVELTEAVIIEKINEVDVLTGKDLEAHPAEPGELFKIPDFLQTGRSSRARLEADDGTVTRVGSNTLFSFVGSNRTINLKRGSLLFHSPEGRGGGRVVTASATASVVGTTIIVEATPDGGFRLFVLEGVAKVTYPDNTSRLLEPGQMTFVQPNLSGATTGESEKGPVLNFDLEAFTEESQLVNGFDSPLASLLLIGSEIADQNQKIEDGSFRRAGTYILLSEGDDVVDLDLDTLNELFEAQEFEPMVLIGAISASVQIVDVEFANLPSGKVLRIGIDGIDILDPADTEEIPAGIPRVMAGMIDSLPADQKTGLANKLDSAFAVVLDSYDDGSVSEDDALAIAKFLLSLDLPFDQRFIETLEERFGPLVVNPNQRALNREFDDSTQVTDPIDLNDDSIQVTDPIDLNDTYFAP